MTQPIVIFGANGGIGESLALILKEKGHDIFLTARDIGSISHLNAPSASVDIRNPEQIEAAIAQADQGDGIKGLAYCIGSITLKPLKATKDEDFLKSYEVNVMGALRALRAAEKSLKKAGGSVVLFSSIAVQQGFSNHSVISTAKGAIEGLVKCMAAEWAPHIRVNGIAPSLTDTAIAKPLLSSEAMAKAIADMHPIPRIGTAEDSAQAAAYLLSPESQWVTGQIFHVDGGRSSLRVKG
jgi:NAD(P)-dependent dehydrogenase (short-subunit alcohol dehydrogenase family)